MVSTIVTFAAAALLGQALKPKAPKQSTVTTQEEEKVVPLPDANSEAVKRKVARDKELRRGRRGYASTLVSGQLGDSAPPPVSQPLVMGG